MTSSKPTKNMPDRKKTFAETVKQLMFHYLVIITLLAILVLYFVFTINLNASLIYGATILSILLPAYQTVNDSGWDKGFRDLPKAKRCNLVMTIIGMVVTAISFLAGTSTLFVC
ncbi:hypothetical protein ACT3UM_21240 [Halomonas sp. AOP13-D3-9]